MAAKCAGGRVTHGAGSLLAATSAPSADGFSERHQVVPFAATRVTSAPSSADVTVAGAAAVDAATAVVVMRCSVATAPVLDGRAGVSGAAAGVSAAAAVANRRVSRVRNMGGGGSAGGDGGARATPAAGDGTAPTAWTSLSDGDGVRDGRNKAAANFEVAAAKSSKGRARATAAAGAVSTCGVDRRTEIDGGVGGGGKRDGGGPSAIAGDNGSRDGVAPGGREWAHRRAATSAAAATSAVSATSGAAATSAAAATSSVAAAAAAAAAGRGRQLHAAVAAAAVAAFSAAVSGCWRCW